MSIKMSHIIINNSNLIRVLNNGKILTLPCRFEGELVQKCQSCGNNETNHIRECKIFELCTRGDSRNPKANCSTCKEYQSSDPVDFPDK